MTVSAAILFELLLLDPGQRTVGNPHGLDILTRYAWYVSWAKRVFFYTMHYTLVGQTIFTNCAVSSTPSHRDACVQNLQRFFNDATHRQVDSLTCCQCLVFLCSGGVLVERKPQCDFI